MYIGCFDGREKEGSSHLRIVIPEGWKECSFFSSRFSSSFIFSFFSIAISLSFFLSLTFYSSSSSFSLLHCSSSHLPLLVASGTVFDVFSREKRKRILLNCSISLSPFHILHFTSCSDKIFLQEEKNSTKFQTHVPLGGDRFTLFDFTWVFSSRRCGHEPWGGKGVSTLGVSLLLSLSFIPSLSLTSF